MAEAARSLLEVPMFDDKEHLRVIVDTPKGSRNKYAYREDLGLFELRKVLPEGVTFPYNFGFIPSTRGGDGDPLDILLIMDEPAFPGCLVTTRVVGILVAEQAEGASPPNRNDRLIGIAAHGRAYAGVRALDDFRPGMLDEVEAFFEHYNRLDGKRFSVIARKGPEEALQVVRGNQCGVEAA